MEKRGHAGRGGDCEGEREVTLCARDRTVRLGRRRVRLEVAGLEPQVLVDVGVDLARGLVVGERLAHPDGLEAPVVARVERRRVDEEHRHLGVRAPRVVLVGPERRRLVGRVDLQLAHRDLLVDEPEEALRPLLAPRRLVEELVVEVAQPVAPRVRRLRHPDVLGDVQEGPRAEVLLDPLPELAMDRLDELDVVLVGDLGVRLALEQVLDVDVVEGADDRAAGDGRDDLDAAQDPELGEPCEDAHVEERGPESAPGQGKPDLRRRSG